MSLNINALNINAMLFSLPYKIRLNQPIRLPGLKPGVCSGLILKKFSFDL